MRAMSNALSGANRKIPSPIPDSAMPFTAPRAVGNQRLSITVWATLPRSPAPTPATTPNQSSSSSGEPAVPASAIAAPSTSAPAARIGRSPYHSMRRSTTVATRPTTRL